MPNNTEELLAELVKWQRVLGMAALKNLAPETLDSKEKRLVYEMTDGLTSVNQISKNVGVSTGTVSNWWSSWFASGLVYKEGVKYKKIVPLKDLSINNQKEEK